MSKRYRKPTKPEPEAIDASTTLPTDHPVAVYYRQSTDGQIGNVSTAIQTIDMVSFLVERGWKESDIHLIDMDGGVSGTKKIDERPGMKELFDLITERQVRAVACQDEDRLFRDITQIQVNIFIEACREANVLVITPSMVYDFANPMTGIFHARQFRFKCEMAAEYLSSIIIGKLARARKRMQLEGRWTGSYMTIGYMVDKRKTLPDGTSNPNWHKYIPFQPYAEVVREYFRLFVSFNGNLRRTGRHIHQHGPYYPDPATTPPPEDFFAKYHMIVNGKGYCPSLAGLRHLFVNAAYIGHWAVNDVIQIYDNHEPIVPVDMFMQAFNYLSQYTLDGSPNKAFHAERLNARPTLDEKRPCERPLCSGYLISLENGEWHNVGTEWIKKRQHYRYTFRSKGLYRKQLWSKVAYSVDEVITELLHAKLKATFDPAAWDEMISESTKRYERERRRIEKQLAALEQTMAQQVVSLDSLTNPRMIRAVQDRYAEAEQEHKRLTSILQGSEDEKQRLKRLSDLRQDFTIVLDEWDNYTVEQRRGILRLLLIRIEALPAEYRALDLTVYWQDGSKDTVRAERIVSKGTRWTTEDIETLLELYDNGATQLEIAKAFPKRIWKHIHRKIMYLRDDAKNAFSPTPILNRESYEMYVQRCKDDPSPHRAASGTPWRPEDDELLLELLDRDAHRVEIADAFPARSWRAIHDRVVVLRGPWVKIRGRKTIRPNETIVEYRLRIGTFTPPDEQLPGDHTGMTSYRSS